VVLLANDTASALSAAELRDLRDIAGAMIPALAAIASLGLQSEVARWRGGRMADRLLDTRTVLRGERPDDGTSTIQAVALYIADQMKRRLATVFD